MRGFSFALAAASTLAFMQIASAADLPRKAPAAPPPPVPVFSWTGFYVGANIGGGWARDHGEHFCLGPTGVPDADCQVLPPGSEHISSSGIIGGGQMGYNWQTGQIVLGIETDFQGADIRGSTTVGGPFGFAGPPPGVALPAGIFTASEKIDWFGTVRGRVGWVPWDRVLIFATGGLIYGHVVADSLFTAPNVGTAYAGSSSATRAGWTVGGGVEYAFTNNWSGKIEGQYYDLGSITVVGNETPLTFPPGGFQHNKNFDFTGAIVRLGLNYMFK